MTFETSEGQSLDSDIAGSAESWALSVALPDGFPASFVSGVPFLHTDHFSLALNLQLCTVSMETLSLGQIQSSLSACPRSGVLTPNPNGSVHAERPTFAAIFIPMATQLRLSCLSINSQGTVSFTIGAAPEPTYVSLGGKMENTVDFSSSDLGLDSLFLHAEGINSMSQLRAVQQFVNNQQLHTLLASGCYFFFLESKTSFPMSLILALITLAGLLGRVTK